MKVILATPFYHQLRGNTITVRRIARGLNEADVETEVISITEQVNSITALKEADLIHGFNAYRFYQFMKTLSIPITKYTITLTGTDLNHDLTNPNRQHDVIACLRDALAVHVFDEKAKRRILEVLPDLERKLFVIAQGTSSSSSKRSPKKTSDLFHFLLPAGIREVKNIPFAIKSLQKLRQTHHEVRLTIVGPVIEKKEGELVKEFVLDNDEWVNYEGAIPHSEMEGLYSHADVVLNTSHSEGQSSAILEAMSYGLPVLVSKNKGNLSLVTHNKTGLVYEGVEQFITCALRLVEQESLRQALGQQAAEYVEKHHSATQEITAILSMYAFSLNLLKKGENSND
ncbi:glycosyltransferase [Guptibacillus hwajinpoensis]|nr:glycosyltransferase [Pseudalkalibacillus hwajinpoensis]